MRVVIRHGQSVDADVADLKGAGLWQTLTSTLMVPVSSRLNNLIAPKEKKMVERAGLPEKSTNKSVNGQCSVTLRDSPDYRRCFRL